VVILHDGDVPAPAAVHRARRGVRLQLAAVRHVEGQRRVREQAAGEAVEALAQLVLEQERSEPRAVDVQIELELSAVFGDEVLDRWLSVSFGRRELRVDDLAVEVHNASLDRGAPQVLDEPLVVEVVGVGLNVQERVLLPASADDRRHVAGHQHRLQGERAHVAGLAHRAEHADAIDLPVEGRLEHVVAREPPFEANALLPGRLHLADEVVDVQLEIVMKEGDQAGHARLADADDRDRRRLDDRHLQPGQLRAQRERREPARGPSAQDPDPTNGAVVGALRAVRLTLEELVVDEELLQPLQGARTSRRRSHGARLLQRPPRRLC
jgi:hypothetical protein